MIVTAALYARVSTPNQEEEDTIDSQIAAIERYMQDHGYDLPSEFYFLDKAVSGARLDRPALDQLRHLASDGAFAMVVCYSPDRLSRSYPHQWVIMDELQRNGVRVEFVNQPDLGDNPQAQLLLGVQGLFAEYERAMIKERLRMGRLYKIRTGQLMHNATPYGYRYVPKDEAGGSCWVIEEREAEAVRQIFTWYTGEEKLTIWAITERLNQSYTHALRRAGTWQYSIVHKILKRTAYIGLTHFNKERILPEVIGTPRLTGRGKRRAAQTETRPKEEWIEVEVPALVDEAVWNRAQDRLKMNKRFAKRNNKHHFYLLRSLLVCATCGYTLQGRFQKGRVYYYCEQGGKHRYPDVERHTCSIAGRIIEPLVWEAVAELISNPQQIAAAWEAAVEKHDATPDELSRLQNRQRKLDRQWVRLLDAFQDGLLNKTELNQRKQRLEQERQTIAERSEQIQRQQKQQSVKVQIIDEFSAFCVSAQKALENPTPEVKQEVLRLLVESIAVEDNAITIKHIIPADDNSRLLPQGKIQNTLYTGYDTSNISILAGVFYEALWIFFRQDLDPVPQQIADLKGLNIGIGEDGSGTQAGASVLLTANGVNAENSTFDTAAPDTAATKLKNGELDAVMLVAGAAAPLVRDLLTTPGIELMPIRRTGAYTSRFKNVSAETLSEGTIDLAHNIPDEDKQLLVVASALVANDDLHPDLARLLLIIAGELHSRGGILEEAGEFPAPLYTGLRMNPDAVRYLENGPTGLERYMPLWIASRLERLFFLLVPVALILYPLLRGAPAAVAWFNRYRVKRRYRHLREIEQEYRGYDINQLDKAIGELETFQEALNDQVNVPTSLLDEYYELRMHTGLTLDRLRTRKASLVAANQTSD